MSDSSQVSAQAHRAVWLQPLGYVKGDWSNRRGSEAHCRSTACQYSRALVPANKAHLHLFALQFWDLDCKICSFSALQTNLDQYKESFEMGISITWCSALPVWWWEKHWQHSEGESWIQRPLGSRGGSCSCTEPSGAALLTGWVWKIPLHLRKQHFWGAHFTPLCDFLLTNLVWCSVFRFRTLFCKILLSEIFEILLRIIKLKIMLSDICKQIVPLVSLVVPNALLHLTGF